VYASTTTNSKITAVNTHATVGDFIVKLDSSAFRESEPMVNREYYLDKPMSKWLLLVICEVFGQFFTQNLLITTIQVRNL